MFSSNNTQYEEDTDVLLNSEMIKTDDQNKNSQYEIETLHTEGFDFDLRDAVIYSAILEPKYFWLITEHVFL